MVGQTLILRGPRQRELAHQLIHKAGKDYVVNIREPTRNKDQNARLWASISDISRAKPEGRMWTTDTWKAGFMHSLGYQCQFEAALDGQGMFPIGMRSSRLSVREMAALITVVQEYGDRHGVEWSEPR